MKNLSVCIQRHATYAHVPLPLLPRIRRTGELVAAPVTVGIDRHLIPSS